MIEPTLSVNYLYIPCVFLVLTNNLKVFSDCLILLKTYVYMNENILGQLSTVLIWTIVKLLWLVSKSTHLACIIAWRMLSFRCIDHLSVSSRGVAAATARVLLRHFLVREFKTRLLNAWSTWKIDDSSFGQMVWPNYVYLSLETR